MGGEASAQQAFGLLAMELLYSSILDRVRCSRLIFFLSRDEFGNLQFLSLIEKN